MFVGLAEGNGILQELRLRNRMASATNLGDYFIFLNCFFLIFCLDCGGIFFDFVDIILFLDFCGFLPLIDDLCIYEMMSERVQRYQTGKRFNLLRGHVREGLRGFVSHSKHFKGDCVLKWCFMRICFLKIKMATVK